MSRPVVITQPTFNQPQPHFKGLHSLLGSNAASKLAFTLEEGYATTKFTQDMVSVLGSRVVAARSVPEAAEVSFFEFFENLLVYFGISALARRVFEGMAHKLSPKTFERDLLRRPLSQLAKSHPQLVNRVASVKGAIILAAFGTAAVAGEYALSFVKNLLTLKGFHHGDFTQVARLEDDSTQDDLTTHPTRQKALRRIGQCLAGAAGLVGVAGLMVRFGNGNNALGKLGQFIANRFDFRYSRSGGYGMSPAQLMAFMAVAAISYMDAARDNLERKEIGMRLAIIMPYILFGAEALQRGLVQLLGPRYPKLINTAPNGTRSLKPYRQLMKEALKQARRELGTATAKAIHKRARQLLAPQLGGKALFFFLPHLIGVLGVGLGTTLINQHFTRQRFARQQRVKPPIPTPVAFSPKSPHHTASDAFQQYILRIQMAQHQRIGIENQGFRVTVGI